MAWTTPATFVSGAVLTAAQMNTISANLNETAPAKTGGAGGIIVPSGVNAITTRSVAEDEFAGTSTTTSTTYVDVGPGPSVSITTGAKALVGITAQLSNGTAGSWAAMSYDVSQGGSQYVTPADAVAIRLTSSGAGDQVRASALSLQSSLTSGLNTFTAKYRVSGGTGTYSFRRLFVVPLS